MALISEDSKIRAGIMKMPCIYTAGGPLSLSVKQTDILLATRTDENIRFYALPTLELMFLAKECKNNIIKDMAKKYRSDISRGRPILIDQIMFIRMALNKLDKRNKFILEKCNVYLDGFMNVEFWACQ
jgi:hypothetical protein